MKKLILIITAAAHITALTMFSGCDGTINLGDIAPKLTDSTQLDSLTNLIPQSGFIFSGKELDLYGNKKEGYAKFSSSTFFEQWIGPPYSRQYTVLSYTKMYYTNAGHTVTWTVDSTKQGNRKTYRIKIEPDDDDPEYITARIK